MARCHICDSVIEVVEVHPITGKIEPCENCMDEINESVLEDSVQDALAAFGLTDVDETAQ